MADSVDNRGAIERTGATPQRREIDYYGRVQGVGFRHTARHLASHFPVAGYVMNLPDGRVRLVVEGEAGDLDRLLAAVAEAMSRYIESVDVRLAEPSGEFAGFEIRYSMDVY